MKNLLKLTVLAFAVVMASCTNYDDQFASLEAQIATLKSQIEGFSSLSSGLSTLQGTVTSLQAAVASLPTSSTDISGLTEGLTATQASIDAITASIATLAADVASGNTSTAAAQAAIATFQADLTTVQANVASILASNNVYTGDVVITNDAELAFAKQLAGKVAIVNGDVFVKVNTANGLSATEVSSVTKLMSTVVGDLGVDTSVDLDFGALTSVSGAYTVVGHSISAAKLTNLGKAFIDYDGSLSIGDANVSDIIFGKPNKATTVDFGNVTTNTLFKSATSITVAYSSGTITTSFSGASTTIDLGDAVTFITGSGIDVNAIASTTTATTITLGGTASNSLSINASKAVVTTAMSAFNGDVSVTAKSFAAASAAQITGAATLTLDGAVNLSSVATATTVKVTDTANNAMSFGALKSATSLTVSTTGALTADVLANGAITATGPTTVSLAAHATGAISAPAATSLTVANYSTSGDAASAVKTLVLKAQTTDITTTTEFPQLVSLTITGKASTGNAAVIVGNTQTTTTIVAAGPMASLEISDTASVTAVTTSGVINSLTLSNTTDLEEVSFSHTHKIGGEGSILKVLKNSNLKSLTTSTDYLNNLTVRNNPKLTSLDLSSYKNVLLSGSVNILMYANPLGGNYKTGTAATPSTATIEPVINSNDLLTFKDYAAKLSKDDADGKISLSSYVDISVVTINSTTSTNTLMKAIETDVLSSTVTGFKGKFSHVAAEN